MLASAGQPGSQLGNNIFFCSFGNYNQVLLFESIKQLSLLF